MPSIFNIATDSRTKNIIIGLTGLLCQTFTPQDLWPVSHDDHVVGGPPEGVYDGGVAADHDDAGDEEGDHQLVPGEVDPTVDHLISPLLIHQSLLLTHPIFSSVSLQ